MYSTHQFPESPAQRPGDRLHGAANLCINRASEPGAAGGLITRITAAPKCARLIGAAGAPDEARTTISTR